jgi:hypothetical protein
MPRVEIQRTAAIIRYRVTNAGGQTIGEDVETIPTAQQANAQTIISRAKTAITGNNAFIAIGPAPTNAQIISQVTLLTRENTAIIKLLLDELGVLGLLDDVSGT